MKINVTQLPETKTYTDKHRHYTQTFPDGFPVHIRRVWNCSRCGAEVGGDFGNKVYGSAKLGLCQGCQDADDPIVQLCIKLTGITPREYQRKHGVAWNE